MVTCGGSCYLYEPILGVIDTILNLAVPLGVCNIANMLLLIRVLHQKHLMRQGQLWKKNRRLLIELLFIVILHNLVWFPLVFCLLILQFAPVLSPAVIDITINRFPFGYYMVMMLGLFVSLTGLPELCPCFIDNSVRPIGYHRIVCSNSPI